MAKPYTNITIIYNPNSTGASERLAKKLQKQLRKQGVDKALLRLTATKRAGHAETLAYDAARATRRPLIIIASGDGGYHEVVNGVMRAQNEGAQATTGLLPAGNANDHYKNLHQDAIEQQILEGRSQTVDLLRVTVTHPKHSWERYAHSYAGIGLTAKLGLELNKYDLNWLNEIWILARAFNKLRAIEIIKHGKTFKYDSVIWSNVGKMSKVLALSEAASADDGKFEVTTFRTRNKLKLLNQLVRAATYGLDGKNHQTSYTFRTNKPLAIQLDGEIRTIAGGSKVTISIAPAALKCVI